jgi:hypothetical protein
MSDKNVRLALRIHDECNGSDVFGSDICTCRPYLIFGIEEAVKEAQKGGSGVVIYFRKEGRALGEVTKVVLPTLNCAQTDRKLLHLVPRIQCEKTRCRQSLRILQKDGEYCWLERPKIPGAYARHLALARCA